jgi:hypothetical protein
MPYIISKKMKKIIIFLFFICFVNITHAQNKYGHQWLFDNFNTIDFRTDSVITGQIQPYPIYNRGASFTSNMCDKNGSIIMQTGGCYIINKDFKLMKGSDSVNTRSTALIGYCKPGEPHGYFPFKQNNIFITYPSDSSKYLLFNMDFENLYPNGSNILMLPPHIYYHSVDITKENGNGEVIEKFKIAIQDTLSRGYLMAVKHSNNRDWWVVIPKFKSNCFFVVPVTSTGVGAARKECLGPFWKKDPDLGGQVAFSADGSKYARVDEIDTIMVYNFDPTTGRFSSPIRLSHSDKTSYLQGVCFSQNSRYLYVTHILKVFQYDLQATDIQGSMTVVGDVSSFSLSAERGALQVMKLAPDGKIYIAGPFSHRFLCVINRPNCKGMLCDFRPYALELKYYNYGALPNNPFFEIPPANYNCDSINTRTSEIVERITISPNPAQLKIVVSSTYIFKTFNIVNLVGQKMLTGSLTDNEKNEIDVSALPNGIYFLQLINNKNQGQALGKFVVER